jgi:hypothetical protein
MDNRQEAIFEQVKDRFLAACRELMLYRLHEQHPGVDVDLLMELVILTGVGYLNQMRRTDGADQVNTFLDNLLQELTIVVCEQDDGLLKEIHQTIQTLTDQEKLKRDAAPPEEADHKVKVETPTPIPGMGLFGFRFSGGGN